MRVNEIFYSFQGEGINVWEPTAFVRLQGCDARCLYCDTKYAQSFAGGTLYNNEALLKKLRMESRDHARWICITGGEPLAHDLAELMSFITYAKMNWKGIKVSIETNGLHRMPEWWPAVDTWDVDIKCPSSGIVDELGAMQDWLYRPGKAYYKFVVSNPTDLDFVKDVAAGKYTQNIIIPVTKFIVSPAIGTDCDFHGPWIKEVIQFCLDNSFRLSLQTHKVVFENKKGV